MDLRIQRAHVMWPQGSESGASKMPEQIGQVTSSMDNGAGKVSSVNGSSQSTSAGFRATGEI